MEKTTIEHISISDLIDKVGKYGERLKRICSDFYEVLEKHNIPFYKLDGYGVGVDIGHLEDHKGLLDKYINEIKELQEIMGIKPMQNDKVLTSSEAVFGFCSWLTTRKEVVKMGASSNCAAIPPLAATFCKTNNLEEQRENWTDYLTHPEEA